jgi:hypothetical protein
MLMMPKRPQEILTTRQLGEVLIPKDALIVFVFYSSGADPVAPVPVKINNAEQTSLKRE